MKNSIVKPGNVLCLNEIVRELKHARGMIKHATAAFCIEQVIQKIEAHFPEVEYRVTWQIDVVAKSAREAAEDVWRNTFRREWPTAPDAACVFIVEWDHNKVKIDLNEEDAS